MKGKKNTFWNGLSNEQKEAKYRALRERHRVKRLLVLEKYGGKCKCCGETELKFLEIDHVNNDGAAHRNRGSWWIVDYLKKRGYPKKGFQLLCSNCNMAKGRYGECPHAVGKKIYGK